MDNKNVIFILFFLACSLSAYAQQRQLVVLKNQTVLARYQVGDVIYFKRSTDKKIQLQTILAFNDTLIMMNLDSVAYYRIENFDIRRKKSSTFGQRLGAYMIAAGIILPAAELINTGLVQKRGASIDEGVAIATGVLLAGGATLVLVKKKYFKLGGKRRILIVEKGSPFFKSKPVQSSLPYIPRN